jgi:hypothetical protein
MLGEPGLFEFVGGSCGEAVRVGRGRVELSDLVAGGLHGRPIPFVGLSAEVVLQCGDLLFALLVLLPGLRLSEKRASVAVAGPVLFDACEGVEGGRPVVAVELVEAFGVASVVLFVGQGGAGRADQVVGVGAVRVERGELLSRGDHGGPLTCAV